MGRYMRKCRRIAEATVMEVTQVVGVRTRAKTLAMAAAAIETEDGIGGESLKRRKVSEEEGSGAGELEMEYLQLRSRSLVMTQRISRSGRNSDVKRRGRVEMGRISRCSSIASCDAVEGDENLRCGFAGGEKIGEDLCSAVCRFECDRERSEIMLNSSEMDSTGERDSQRNSIPQLSMPSAEEIEEFFILAEKSEKEIFASRYNFDVDCEIPLEGRYEWVRIS